MSKEEVYKKVCTLLFATSFLLKDYLNPSLDLELETTETIITILIVKLVNSSGIGDRKLKKKKNFISWGRDHEHKTCLFEL